MIKIYHELYVGLYVSCFYSLPLTAVPYFQGTWAFQSLRLALLPQNNMVQVIHNRLDDLESFYHVLLWVSLQHARHGLNPEALYDKLTRLFDDAIIVHDTAYAGTSKQLHMISDGTLDLIRFQNPPLIKLLRHISMTFVPLYKPPPQRNAFQASTKEDEQYYQNELRMYEYRKFFLDSKGHSDWMEVAFQKALQLSDDEWGPIEYILNEKKSPVLNSAGKRKYSDMKTSMLQFTQGGIFNPPERIVEEGQYVAMVECEDSNQDTYSCEAGGKD